MSYDDLTLSRATMASLDRAASEDTVMASLQHAAGQDTVMAFL